jgi:hypothetical protein
VEVQLILKRMDMDRRKQHGRDLIARNVWDVRNALHPKFSRKPIRGCDLD